MATIFLQTLLRLPDFKCSSGQTAQISYDVTVPARLTPAYQSALAPGAMAVAYVRSPAGASEAMLKVGAETRTVGGLHSEETVLVALHVSAKDHAAREGV